MDFKEPKERFKELKELSTEIVDILLKKEISETELPILVTLITLEHSCN